MCCGVGLRAALMFARGASAYVVRPGSFIRHVNRFAAVSARVSGPWLARGARGLVVGGLSCLAKTPLTSCRYKGLSLHVHTVWLSCEFQDTPDRSPFALRGCARWLSVARPGPAVARAPRPALDRSGARSATRRRGRARPRGLAWGLWPVRARAAARRRPDGRGVHVTPTACSSKH